MHISKKDTNESKKQDALPGASATTWRMRAFSRDQGSDQHHWGSRSETTGHLPLISLTYGAIQPGDVLKTSRPSNSHAMVVYANDQKGADKQGHATWQFDKSIDYKGLQFEGLYGFSNQPGGFSDNNAYSAGVQYRNGPVTAGLAFLQVNSPNDANPRGDLSESGGRRTVRADLFAFAVHHQVASLSGDRHAA
ncbi:hypothetical protein [Paraburkholderia sp.]|uniref:hypothetical protein n=1 Tax=Paraburkholderia sp. TaxID=1926495 RepID=UPI002AFF466D|nr:hypothetical protein [Paraburkholderia sp.]